MSANRRQPNAHNGRSLMPDLLSDLGSPSNHARQGSAKSTGKPDTFKQQSETRTASGTSISFNKKASSSTKKPVDPDPEPVNDSPILSVKDILSRTNETDPTKVYEITLRAEKLIRIPDLTHFKKVRIVDLSSNQIETLTGLEVCKDLRELKIYDNKVGHLYGIEELKELNILQAQHNRILNLGKGLQLLKKLKLLRLDSNRISRIDLKDVTSCVSLTSLDVSFNTLQSLAFINCLPNLEELFATNNQISEIPDLNRCKKLTELTLSNNKITNARGVDGHPSLLVLDLEGNQLQSIKAIGKVPKLETLILSRNHFQDIGHIQSAFPALDVLDVSNNSISDSESFLTEVGLLEDLRELCLLGNRFPCPVSDQRPFTHAQILGVAPNLEVLDGMTIRKPTTQATHSAATPCMRPMTASSAISTRFVQHQMDTFTSVVQPFEAKGIACYEQLRQSLDKLPKEKPKLYLADTIVEDSEGDCQDTATRPSTATRLSSRCSGRARLEDALNFANTQYDKKKT